MSMNSVTSHAQQHNTAHRPRYHHATAVGILRVRALFTATARELQGSVFCWLLHCVNMVSEVVQYADLSFVGHSAGAWHVFVLCLLYIQQ